MFNLDFFGGVNEIGGNKILLHHDDSKYFLDFGMSFSQANKYFSEFLQPRKTNGVLDFIEFGLLPKMKGIYREDYMKHSGLPYDRQPGVDGVFLSHAHMDHSAYINHLRYDIPIYLSEETYLILKLIEDTSRVSFTDLINLKTDFQLTPRKRMDGYKRLPRNHCQKKRKIKMMKPYKYYEVGDLKVKMVPVDHSLPGANAYLVETDDNSLVYTGDFRFHGRKPKLSQKLVKACQKLNPHIMICEGTRMLDSDSVSEKDVQQIISTKIRDYKGFVAINYPIRDLDRLLTFYNIAQEVGRELVVNLKQAYMLNLFKGKGYPDISDVAIYVPRKGWGLIDNESYAFYQDQWICSPKIDEYQIHFDYNRWERDLLNQENTINYTHIRENPAQYLFRCDFFELKELIDIKPEKGLYIRSMTEPFDEETFIDYKKVLNWLEHFNLKMFQVHASGHASGKEILEMIREINPEKVYPVHTLSSSSFQELEENDIEVIIPPLKK